MNAADSQNGVQTLRFSSKGYLGNTDINNVTVNSGRLNLGMHSGMKGNRLSLIGSGGTFSPTGTGGDIGTATFAEGEWYAGKVSLDIEGEASYDKIVFEGSLEKTGNGISLELSFDEYTIAELIGASGEDEFVLSDMITYAAGSSIEGTALGGSSGKIRWEAVFGETSMSVSFSAIPEPSEIRRSRRNLPRACRSEKKRKLKSAAELANAKGDRRMGYRPARRFVRTLRAPQTMPKGRRSASPIRIFFNFT